MSGFPFPTDLKEIKITDLAETGVIETRWVTKELVDVVLRNENLGGDKYSLEFSDLDDDEGANHWGFKVKEPAEGRVPLTIWSETEDGDTHEWSVMMYRHPETGSTKMTGLIADGHGYCYLEKIL